MSVLAGGGREDVIQDIDVGQKQIYVHYLGGREDEDEWVACGQKRVQAAYCVCRPRRVEKARGREPAPHGTMTHRVCAECSEDFACPASFRGKAPKCSGCPPRIRSGSTPPRTPGALRRMEPPGARPAT